MELPKESQVVEYKRKWRDVARPILIRVPKPRFSSKYSDDLALPITNSRRLGLRWEPFGNEDDGSIAKLDNVQVLMENLPNKIHSNLGFYAEVNSHTDDVTGWKFIAIVVEPQDEAISYEGKYYIRSGSTTQELRGHELLRFLKSRMDIRWEERPRPEANLDDIDDEAIKYFVDRGVKAENLDESVRDEDKETILRKLRLITRDGHLKNAALLLFGKDIQEWCQMAVFRIGRFGASQADLILHHDVACPLIMMPKQVMQVLRMHYLISTDQYKGLDRLGKLEIPEEGLREILCNAIMHKDYEGTFIQMRIWEKEIELWNPGRLPQDFTIDTLMQKHESLPRNPLIANAFFIAGFIESWGRGYEKIRTEFTKEKLQMPVFEEVRGGFMATIQREKFMSVQYGKNGLSGNDSGNDGGNDRGNDGGNDRGNERRKVDPNIVRLLELINDKVLTVNEMMTLLNLSNDDSFRKRYLKPALTGEYVSMTLPDKPTSKKQAYYLSEKGLAKLRELKGE